MNNLVALLSAQTIGRIMGAGLLLTGLYYMTLYDDGSLIDQSIAAVTQELAVEEEKKKDTDATLKQVQEMQEKVGSLSLKYQEISKRLPSALFAIDLNKGIDEYAQKSGVSVKEKRPTDNVPREVVEEVPVEVVLEGTYAELARFTYLVASAERISRLQNVLITAAEGNVRTDNLKLVGTIVGYKLAPAPVKPAEDNIEAEVPQ